MNKKITVKHGKCHGLINTGATNTTKKIVSKSTRSCTFDELWNTLSINYTRNRRDIVSAYGGSEYYHKIDLLYRQGITTDSSSPDETRKNTHNGEQHKKLDTHMAKPVSITAYFTHASSSSPRDLVNQPLSASDKEKPPNKAIIKLIILTNELLTSQDRFITLKNAYQHGIFYAILTLKRTDKEKALPITTTKNWHNASLFRLTLSANPPLPDFDVSANFARFYAQSASNSTYLTTTRIEQDEEVENEFFRIDTDDDSDGEEAVHDNQGDNGDNTPHDNGNHCVKKFARFGGSVSTSSYRLEIYHHFFSHFFHATKGLPHRKQFLADFL